MNFGTQAQNVVHNHNQHRCRARCPILAQIQDGVQDGHRVFGCQLNIRLKSRYSTKLLEIVPYVVHDHNLT